MQLFFAADNIRSIKSMNLAELKPITVLLGANNSGKSSFLRLFPLLRQSIEDNKNPMNFNGNIISYGSYSSAVTDNNNKEEISFRFKVKDLDLQSTVFQTKSSKNDQDIKNTNILENNFEDIDYNVVIGLEKKRVVIRKISCNIGQYDISVEIEYAKDGYSVSNYKINGINIESKTNGHIFRSVLTEVNNNTIFPSFNIIGSKSLFRKQQYQTTFKEVIYDEFFHLFSEFRSNQSTRKFSVDWAEKLIPIIFHKPQFTDSEIGDISKSATNSDAVLHILNLMKDDRDIMSKINNLCAVYWSFIAINSISEIFREFFLENVYLKPDRVEGKRYYNYEEQSTQEIDPSGKNVPMILASMTKKELDEFCKWLEHFLKIKLIVKKMGIGFRIMFERDRTNVNFPYTGHGISQLLPVFALLWLSTKEETTHKIKSRIGSFCSSIKVIKPITIEQPESHLHPRHQAKIADALACVLERKNEDFNPIFVIETHSKAFMNRLGKLIEEKRISRNDVSVILFSENAQNLGIKSNDDRDGYCQIKETFFDKDGLLNNWPLGFLE